MNLFDSMDIGATGLKAQQIRMNVIANNISNIDTTQTPQGGPYKRKEALFATLDSNEQMLLVSNNDESFGLPKGVKVIDIATDRNPTKMIYRPDHPNANPQGYVAVPNIDTVTEMINMISASRAYEANLNVISSSRDMMTKTLEIGR